VLTEDVSSWLLPGMLHGSCSEPYPPADADPRVAPCPAALLQQTVRDKCFKICISSPGSSLSSGDQKCLSRCMDRYQDVSRLGSSGGGICCEGCLHVVSWPPPAEFVLTGCIMVPVVHVLHVDEPSAQPFWHPDCLPNRNRLWRWS
jgi:hypothetical protein